MTLWSQLARAAIALAARLEMCSAVKSYQYSTGMYEGKLYLTDDFYIVVAKRMRNNETKGKA